MTLNEAIINVVESFPGIKSTELIVKLGDMIVDYSIDQISDVLNELTTSKDIVEVEYVLPTMPYRIKSLYFPKGTQISA